MVITNNALNVTFSEQVHKRDIFKAHVRDIVLNTDEETITVSLAGDNNPHIRNFILIDYNAVTSPLEANVSDLYTTVLGYFAS